MTTITRIPAGKLDDGRTVNRFVIANDIIEVSVLEWGVCATAIKLAEFPHNLLLDYPAIGDYERDLVSMGAVVGRFASRIREGRFELGGRSIQLSRNHGSYHLHGGALGFARRLWHGEATQNGARFSLLSRSGEEGYPGNLDVSVEIRLLGNAVEYRYQAATDEDTILNLTNHSYFNLDGSADILGHRLSLEADHYLPIDDENIPTGEIRPVAGSPFDFRKSKPVGRDIDLEDDQLRLGAGYDHCFVLRDAQKSIGSEPRLAAKLCGQTANMTVLTTEPGIQLYTGNRLPRPREGVCLETQHFPDSPNQPGFPSTCLRPGETYSSITRYRFEPAS